MVSSFIYFGVVVATTISTVERSRCQSFFVINAACTGRNVVSG